MDASKHTGRDEHMAALRANPQPLHGVDEPRAAVRIQRKGSPLRDADRSSYTRYAVRAYEGGNSVRAIAAWTGNSYGRTHAILKAAGVTFRPRGGRNY